MIDLTPFDEHIEASDPRILAESILSPIVYVDTHTARSLRIRQRCALLRIKSTSRLLRIRALSIMALRNKPPRRINRQTALRLIQTPLEIDEVITDFTDRELRGLVTCPDVPPIVSFMAQSALRVRCERN